MVINRLLCWLMGHKKEVEETIRFRLFPGCAIPVKSLNFVKIGEYKDCDSEDTIWIVRYTDCLRCGTVR